MKQVSAIFFVLLCGWQSWAQRFEVLADGEAYQTSLNQLVRIPIRIKNRSDKPQFFVVRKVKGELTDTQKGYFCISNNCLDASIVEFSKRIGPGETLQDLFYNLESGMQPMATILKFESFPKGSPHESVEYSINLSVEEKARKSFIYQSREITIQDVYPNPVQENAYIDYNLHTESVKAKITVHNILGKLMGEYDLPISEDRVKIQAEDLTPGVYFYTVYLNNNGILTRKLIVRR